MPAFSDVIPRLPVVNLARTIAFYTGVLGFEIDVIWPESRPTFAILKRDTVSIGFFEPNEHQPGPPGYAELYVEVAGVSDWHTSLSAHVQIEWGPEVYAYGRREFAVRDPDRYLLIFTEPTDEPASTPEPG